MTDPNPYNSLTCPAYTDPADAPYTFGGDVWPDAQTPTEEAE